MARTDKGIIPLKPSLISSHLIAYYHTDATDWNQTKPVRDSRSVVGRLAVWPTPNTGCEPTFCIDVSREHTPINFPTRNVGFQQEYDSTIAASEDLNFPWHSGASSSSHHTAASTVPTLWKRGWFGTSPKKLSANYVSVASRTSTKESCADMDRETVVSSFFWSVLKGKRNRDQHVVQTLRGRKISTKSLNGELNWPSEEKNWLSKDFSKLRQTWRSNIGKREILILLFMRSIRSSNPNDYNYNKRINGLIRIKTTK